MDDLLWAPEAPRVPAARPSGSDKRRARNKLPKAVLVFEKATRVISGAIILVACGRVNGEEKIFWNVSRAVRLTTPVGVTNDMVQYTGAIFMLNFPAETRLRGDIAACGGLLRDHFPEFATVRWKCFTVGFCTKAAYDDPLLMAEWRTASSHAFHLGVTADPVERRSVIPPPAEAVAAESEEEEAIAEGEVPASADAPEAPAASLHDVQTRLRSLSKPHGGTVKVQYDPQVILDCLGLSKFVEAKHNSASSRGCFMRYFARDRHGCESERRFR